jgi:acetyl esterase/lipase
MIYLYAARNFSALAGLASPEPMANMYDPTYFRATWVLTALDAGFWTAMKIRSRWLRDLAGIVFSVFYLFATERADEKVRKVRGMLTVEHLRVAWNKGTSPYLSFFQGLMRPRFTRWPPRQVRIARPPNSDYEEPVSAWLYYDGPLVDLKHHERIVLDIPGGGFVAMDPRCNDDKLFAWAAKSGLPVLSLDYKKAPEFPYPYALNECFDVYYTLMHTRGRCIGLSGDKVPKLILTGDSAGGNLTVATTLMILETHLPHLRGFKGRPVLPIPDGVVCFYPTLDMNIGNWMSDEQMSLIRDRKARKTNRSIVRRKSQQYNDLVGTPHHSDDEEETRPLKGTSESAIIDDAGEKAAVLKVHPEYSHSRKSSPTTTKPANPAEPMKTRLATSSMISYFNDRVLTPEMMRAMIILYIGPHNRPDFSADYLLSPVLAPDVLLQKFPKTYFMTGERDPLVDDTVIFAGRLRLAKEAARRPKTPGSLRLTSDAADGEIEDAAEVVLIPGTSHGFMQFPAVYPPAWRHFDRCAEWFEQLFAHADRRRTRTKTRGTEGSSNSNSSGQGRAHYAATESSGDEDKPLEISMTKMNRGRSATLTGGGDKREEGGEGNVNATASGGTDAKLAASSSPPQGSSNKVAATAAAANGNGNSSSTKRVKKGLNKTKSLVKLDSSEDLLGRRMQGLASGLTGTGDDD